MHHPGGERPASGCDGYIPPSRNGMVYSREDFGRQHSLELIDQAAQLRFNTRFFLQQVG